MKLLFWVKFFLNSSSYTCAKRRFCYSSVWTHLYLHDWNCSKLQGNDQSWSSTEKYKRVSRWGRLRAVGRVPSLQFYRHSIEIASNSSRRMFKSCVLTTRKLWSCTVELLPADNPNCLKVLPNFLVHELDRIRTKFKRRGASNLSVRQF